MPFKDRWAHFWYYYKVHVTVGVIALVIIGWAAVETVNRVVPDLTVGLYVNGFVSEEYIGELKARIEASISTEDEPRIVEISSLTYDTKVMDEMAMAVMQKFMAEVATGKCMLYVVDGEYLADFEANGIAEKSALVGRDALGTPSNVIGTPSESYATPQLYAILPILRNDQINKPKKILEREYAETAYAALIE